MAEKYTSKRLFIEFSKIYKRLMEVEIQLRERIISAFKTVYKEKAFYRLKPYLNKIKINYNYTRKSDGVCGNYLNNIINSNEDDEKKLKNCIYILYLRDLLGILDYKNYYRDKFLIRFLYHEKPSHNDVKKFSSCLALLRNCVMHFNFKSYIEDRKDFINALIFFENHLNCFMRPINNIPSISNITVQGILDTLYLHSPYLFNENDRILCDVYDDIAILNGKPAEHLPQYWSILRIKYELLSKENKLEKKFNPDDNDGQMSIFDLLEQH